MAGTVAAPMGLAVISPMKIGIRIMFITFMLDSLYGFNAVSNQNFPPNGEIDVGAQTL
ncbi:hypothetical protein [Herbaspirillum huttiense]|uniref:hypothetical protein n=1 Tax=Herbaspirillum huttiense TaxID=863372 RepID=UPI002176CDAB|nr:hypothetical protein [Herbaspirillum huttiense]UWE15079.1 hypothetical protein NY669_18505 [Herbaspirillum huttiense]